MALRKYLSHVDATAIAFGHLHFPYRRRVGRTIIADVASARIPRDGDLRPAYGLFTFTPRAGACRFAAFATPCERRPRP